MAKKVRISLANKCQLLFGAAVVLILTSALAVVWTRMQELANAQQVAAARSLSEAWLSDRIQLGGSLRTVDELGHADRADQGLTLVLVQQEDFPAATAQMPFLAAAIAAFEGRPDRGEYHETARDALNRRLVRYARAIRDSELDRLRGVAAGEPAPPQAVDPLRMILVIQRRAVAASEQFVVNGIYIIAAGLLAGLLAIGTFWFITTRIILSPVRLLRDTAEKVAEGDLNIRAEINTGDEFEQLSTIFNQMLENLKSNQDQLRQINKSLDLKLGELAQTNLALFEANKVKGEFLANVSHELRTPLNAIIGFAEVLGETLQDRTGPMDEKRKRYAHNIVISSRQLLDLITDLLDLAKIEAGRMELRISQISVQDTAEALLNIIRPQAEKKQIELALNVGQGIPLVHTDAGKLHQIVGNFLSNAVKFTPPGGRITLSAQVVEPARPEQVRRVAIAVADTGPGIPPEQQERIFEKFHQLDATVTREHTGTGLGLTICRELSELLQGEILLESQVGQGATFTLLIPMTLEQRSVPLMPELTSPAGSRA